jgi:general stress protein CsbA
MKRNMYWVTGLIGLALLLAPFVLGYNGDNNALWASIVLGGVILVASALEGFVQDHSNWEYWLAGLAGILAIVAPFLLQFNGAEQSTQMWTSIVLGVVVVLISLYEITTETPQIE